jgi:hypothetical protein
MSTNIQIDVVLRKLQEQSEQIKGKNQEQRAEREEEAELAQKKAEKDRRDKRGPADNSELTVSEPGQSPPTGEQLKKKEADSKSKALNSTDPDIARTKEEPAGFVSGITVGGFWWGFDNYGKTSQAGFVYLPPGVASTAVPLPSWLSGGTSGSGFRETSYSYGYRIGSGNGEKFSSSSFTNSLPPPPAEDTFTVTGPLTDPQLTGFGACTNGSVGNRDVGTASQWQIRVARLVLPAGKNAAVVAYSVRSAAYSFLADQISYDILSPVTNDPLYPKCTLLPDYKAVGPRNSATISTDLRYDEFCYFVDAGQVQQISLPKLVSDYLKQLNPEAQLQTGISPFGPVPTFPAPPQFNYIDSKTMIGISGVTPQIFYELNQLSPYSSDALRTADGYKGKPITPWVFEGGYKLLRESTSEGQLRSLDAYTNVASSNPPGFLHAQYKGDRQEAIELLSAELNRKIKRYTSMKERQSLSSTTSSLEFVPVFDWGAPGYCKAQLTALGFKPENFS